MGKKSEIEWCDSTVPPTSGCGGCELWNPESGGVCYAAQIHRRFTGTNPFYRGAFDEIHHNPGKLAEAAKWSGLAGTDRPAKPWLNGMPRIIFVSPMADSLSAGVDTARLAAELWEAVESEAGRRHLWLWLTKRPERMADDIAFRQRQWPENLIPGTSVTAKEFSQRERLDALRRIKSRYRFVSLEPLLGPVKLRKGDLAALDWVIAGGANGVNRHERKALCLRPEWIRPLREQCVAARVPFFFKGWGVAWGKDNMDKCLDGQEWREVPEEWGG